MLLRIERHQARLGMFVERLEGAWLDHPFWLQRFSIDSYEELEKLKASGITALVIDLSKGPGPRPAPPKAVAAPPPPKLVPVAPRHAPSIHPDMRRASETLTRATSALGDIFDHARDGRAICPERASAIVDEIAGAMRLRPQALLGITRLKSKDEYSYYHSVAVCALMTHFGRFLRLDDATVQALGMAGLFHDIGKVSMPAELLGKADALSEDEARLMRTHPLEGYRILENQDLPPLVKDVCRHHHERMDGVGYPDGLSGEDLTLGARIAAICDVYDAVTSVRPYKEAWSAKTAFRRMWQWEGHFDRALLSGFFASIGVKG